MIIWRITDGKAGHDSQSRGLIQALNALVPCTSYDIAAPPLFKTILNFFSRRFPAADLPDPDIIIGAGHATHLPMLAARRARGGKIALMMRPSLPVRWFDLCFIPKHDDPETAPNVVLTDGAINPIVPSTEQRPDQGLILIGGASRHYGWDNDGLIGQIQAIIKTDPRKWTLTDSPRTPEVTRRSLLQLDHEAVEYVPYNKCNASWLPSRLHYAGTVWVTRDSMSMIYESLTAGAAVGLLDVPEKPPGRIVRAVAALAETQQAISYRQWRDGQPLSPLKSPLHEADRCARILLERFSLMKNG